MPEARCAKIFAKNVAKLRKSHGYTVKQVGERCGVTGTAISRIENGLRFPEPATVDRLADLYRVAIADLFSPGGAEGKAYSIKATQENKLDWLNAELAPAGFKLIRTTG